jgi:hypothetical protein
MKICRVLVCFIYFARISILTGHAPKYQILEKSKFSKETGAAIHLPPNCTALLKWMDVDPTTFGGTLLRAVCDSEFLDL